MLKISSQGEYALLLVKFLASSPDETYPLSRISSELWVKEPFLRKIASLLEKASIIATHKGRFWGVTLAVSTVSVYDVLLAVWEDLEVALCSSSPACSRNSVCAIVPLVSSLQQGFVSILRITKVF